MYNFELAKFHNVSYEFSKHGISANGRAEWGRMGNIENLKATYDNNQLWSRNKDSYQVLKYHTE